MTDRMRLLELCLKESAATYSWNLTGNYLTCTRGCLSFILVPTLGETDIRYTLSYRYSAFDKIYHSITLKQFYPGYPLTESAQPVPVWSLMGVSAAMRGLVEKMDRFVTAFTAKVKNPEENLNFLHYLYQKRCDEGLPELPVTNEEILTQIMMGDYDGAAMASRHAIAQGDRENAPFYRSVIDYSEKFK